MLTSLFTGISGMNANSTSLSVIGDNIANMNTIGFKASRVAFGDVLSQTLSSGTNNSQIGRGVLLSSVSPLFTQGSFESTGNALDLAIDGNGFFIVNDSSGSFYTRAGQFSLDKDGNIVNPDDLKLQGYQYTATGQPTGVIGDINVSAFNHSTGPTGLMTISANVDSRVPVIPGGFDINDQMNTSHFSSALSVYDSLGNSRVVTLHFTKVSEDPVLGNTWEWNAVVGASDSASGVEEIQASGTLQFDNTGTLISPMPSTVAASFDFGGGAAAGQAIDLSFTNFSQFANESATLFQSQDGYPAGTLTSLSISQEGVISGIFTNGQIKPLSQLAIAHFTAATELNKFGRNLYAESYDSGQKIVGTANNAGMGRVLSSSLELSNVDLSREFVNMISAQRGFQANSRIITTTDSLLQELVNLRR